jgi:hypothetical protein
MSTENGTMRTIQEMNIAEMAYNVGHICGRLNMKMKYATQLAYEFKDYKLHFYDGYWKGNEEISNEMLEVRQGNANGI